MRDWMKDYVQPGVRNVDPEQIGASQLAEQLQRQHEQDAFAISISKIAPSITSEATAELRWVISIGERNGDTVEIRTLQQKWITREHEGGSGRLTRAEQEWRTVPDVRV